MSLEENKSLFFALLPFIRAYTFQEASAFTRLPSPFQNRNESLTK